VQYALWRTHTSIGTFRPLDTALAFQNRDISVGGYFSSGNQQTFTSNFHLIELPVSINYQLLRNLPLRLGIGGAYGRLLQSNALTYDNTARVYYANSAALQRNQFSVFSSLQYSIVSRPHYSVAVGPLAQWQLRSFQKDDGTAGPSLRFAGLKAAVEF
jgi:hypothetical protein